MEERRPVEVGDELLEREVVEDLDAVFFRRGDFGVRPIDAEGVGLGFLELQQRLDGGAVGEIDAERFVFGVQLRQVGGFLFRAQQRAGDVYGA